MARRKKPIEPIEEVVEVEPKFNPIDEANAPKPIEPIVSNNVRKLIDNPLRLNRHIVLSDDKVFPIPGELLKDEMFMLHIDYLITLKKLERV